MSATSIDQTRPDHTRQVFLTFSLVQIVIQHQKFSLEMAAIRGMRRKLAMKGPAHVRKTAVVHPIDKRLSSHGERKIKRKLVSSRGYRRCESFSATSLGRDREDQFEVLGSTSSPKIKGEAS